MTRQCNRISLDEAALLKSLARRGEQVLQAEAGRQTGIMKQEVRMTTYGDAPGKAEWREEIARNIGITARTMTADSLSADVGYSPSSKADEVRAMVVGYGSGDKAEGGGTAIHAGPSGRSVWDGDLDGKHPSGAKSEYLLPEAFNQAGNAFVDNAMRRMKTQFGDRVEGAYAAMPDAVYHGKVRVDEA